MRIHLHVFHLMKNKKFTRLI